MPVVMAAAATELAVGAEEAKATGTGLEMGVEVGRMRGVRGAWGWMASEVGGAVDGRLFSALASDLASASRLSH